MADSREIIFPGQQLQLEYVVQVTDQAEHFLVTTNPKVLAAIETAKANVRTARQVAVCVAAKTILDLTKDEKLFR